MQLLKTRFLVLSLCSFVLIGASCKSFGAWEGVDEVVLEKTARDAGRESWGPLIEIEEGDLGLFAFMLAGLVGGFFLGYYYHCLFAGKGNQKTGK